MKIELEDLDLLLSKNYSIKTEIENYFDKDKISYITELNTKIVSTSAIRVSYYTAPLGGSALTFDYTSFKIVHQNTYRHIIDDLLGDMSYISLKNELNEEEFKQFIDKLIEAINEKLKENSLY